MRFSLLLLCAGTLAFPALAADKKKPASTSKPAATRSTKPAVSTKTTVQVGGAPKSTSSSSLSFGFSGLDKNSDGYISRQEFSYNRQSSQAASEFDRLDANKDGRLSRSEYK